MTSTLLVILDGWGHGEANPHNAIHVAKTPTWDRIWSGHPHGLLECSGEAVGLPKGQMGNSEVGHMSIGAGRIVHQDLTRIDAALADSSFAQLETIRELSELAATRRVHIAGLLSPGGVHSHERQIWALVDYLSEISAGVSIHAFLDGRDTPPKSASVSLQQLEERLNGRAHVNVASICGRYYAMDRDERWDRTQRAYNMLLGDEESFSFEKSTSALEAAYARGETDEFVQPTCTNSFQPVRDGDVFLFMNFRADRARQLSQSFVVRNFNGFQRLRRPKLSRFYTLTAYGLPPSTSDSLLLRALFEPERVRNSLGECIARNKLQQLRIAESEKYAHVTYFFSGGSEKPFSYEKRRIIDSPPVTTYDLCPRMSADAVAMEVSQGVLSGDYGFIVCNFANADMVGHTGNFAAAIEAVECIDECLEKILDACAETQSHCFVTADHGNAECMYNSDTKQFHTAHTNNLVPFVYVGPDVVDLANRGSLADIAPTILDVMGMPNEDQMTGKSLVVKLQHVQSTKA